MPEPLDSLLSLSHRIGLAGDLAILGEGNTSARTGDDTFLVKASGSSLGTLAADQLTECRLSTLLEVIDRPERSDREVDAMLTRLPRSRRWRRTSTPIC
jgi:rhamnose utilization protein RhaD (predicted bifunctional aldolase and dehydrogenase)